MICPIYDSNLLIRDNASTHPMGIIRRAVHKLWVLGVLVSEALTVDPSVDDPSVKFKGWMNPHIFFRLMGPFQVS